MNQTNPAADLPPEALIWTLLDRFAITNDQVLRLRAAGTAIELNSQRRAAPGTGSQVPRDGLIARLRTLPALEPSILDCVESGLGLSEVVEIAGHLPSLAFILPSGDREHLTRADLVMFDIGFVRVSGAVEPGLTASRPCYIRSDHLEDLRLLGEPTGGIVAMSTLGSYGQFGNQLFQYAFMKLYGLRGNCRVQTSPWIGNTLYGIADEPCTPGLPRQIFTEFTGVERTLWYLDEPPSNLEFVGFFQELPESWRLHRRLFRRLFSPLSRIGDPVDAWLRDAAPPGTTLVGLHLRRGDYVHYDPVRVPWFRVIPTSWYRSWLAEIWPTLAAPRLLIATDDPGLIADFADFQPLIAPASLAQPEYSFFPDFHSLCRCDVIAAVNSSFSRMAALLADDQKRAVLPNMRTERFEPYDAWQDDGFWERFEG